MRVVRLSESCIIFKELSTEPAPIANTLNESPPLGLIEAVPAFNQLAVYFEPDAFDSAAFEKLLFANSPLSVSMERGPGGEVNSSALSSRGENQPQTRSGDSGGGQNSALVIIPALYNGPDLEAAAKSLSLSIEALIQFHSQTIYTVEAIGFCPGFPYLAGLPKPLQNLPRKSTPRTAVEPGSIGITGDQCCIYPLVRPGGWNIIAQTPITLVDPDSNYFPLQVGEKIQFQPITVSQFQELRDKRL